MVIWRLLSALDRKLIRDIWQMRGQMVAIISVIACGVGTFVMSLTTQAALSSTQQAYYDRYRFADIFANLKQAPNTLIPRLGEIAGVARVQTRVVRDVILDVPGLREPAAGRLISIPETPQPDLNELHLMSGRYIEPGRDDEVLVTDGFAKTNGYQLGDRVTAILNGRKKPLRIVGTVLSPEYIYTIRLGSLVPDDRRFGILWMGRRALSAAFNMEGAFNDVTMSLMHGASPQQVIEDLDLLLAPYGGLGAHTRQVLISHRFLSDVIKQLARMGTIVPSLFLSVAAFLLNVVLSRQVALQREQIAALKAFGYTNREVGIHYLKLVLLVVILGVLLGCGVGSLLGRHLTGLYALIYKFPLLLFSLPPRIIALALLVSLGAAALGTLGVIRKAVQLPPAEAMRPEPPASFRPTLVERLGLRGWFSPAAKMILRHLERRPLKSFFSMFGIAMAVAVQLIGRFPADSLGHLLTQQFEVSERQHVRLTLNESTSWQGIYELQHLPGVLLVEPRRMVLVRFRHNNIVRRTLIQGLVDQPVLNNLVDESGRTVPLPEEGVVMNEKLAQVLGLEVGQEVTIEFLQGTRRIVQVPLAGLITENLGTFAYMNLRSLNRLMREGNSFSEANLLIDSAHADELYDELRENPRAANVGVKRESIDSFRRTVMENLLQLQYFNVIFASVIALGVVYNTTRIALSERGRELASLRVLGLTRGEISYILLGELAVLTLAAIPLGVVCGLAVVRLVCFFLNSEMYRIPFVISPHTLGVSVSVVLISALISGALVRRQLDHLDLIAVLKTRE